MYKSEIIKQARMLANGKYKDMSDEDILYYVEQAQPDLEIEEDPQEAGLFDGGFSDFGESVLKGADNFVGDVATGITKAFGKETEGTTPGHILGLRDDEYKFGKTGIIGRTIGRGGEFFENTWEDAKANTRGEQGMAQNVYNMGGEALKFASGTFGDVIGSSIKTIAPDNLEKKVGDLVHEGLTETETGKWIAKTMTDFEKDMKFLKENDPAAYRKYRATFGYIEGGLDLVGLKKVNGLYRMGSGEIKHLPLDQVKKLTQEGVKKLSEASKKVKDIVKTRKEKTFGQVKNIIDSLPKPSKEYQKAVTKNGIEFEVEKTPTLFDDFNDLIFTKKNEELAVQSVFPKQTKEKGLNARLNAGQRALKGIEQLYDDRARGIVTANIHEMGGGVEGVQQGLEYWGKKIGELTDIDTTINFSKEVKELEKSLSEKFAKLNPEMFNRVKNIVDEFNNIGSEVTIKELQKGLSNIKSSVFSNFEVTKELASTSTGKALGKLLDALTEKFNATIDIVSGNSKELMQAKAKYSNYLKIQKDLTDSFIVAQRNAGKGLSKQAGAIGGMYELLNNPNIGGVLKGLLLKKSGELISRAKSRDGNWEMLIRNLDRKAVKEYNIRKKYEGNKNMGDSNSDNTNIPNNMSNTNSDISTKSAVKEVFKDEEIIEFVQDVAKQIEESVGDIEALKDIKEGLKDFELPKKYKQILDEKIDTYIKDVENYMKEVDSDLDNYSLADIYGEDLTKSFNRLQGIEKRAKKTSGTDKLSTIEFETSPAYKSFSDKAQEYINENNLDLSVQELYEQMIDSKSGVKFQVNQEFKAPEKFTNDLPVTSFLIKELEGKTNISKGFIENVTRQQGVKQSEKIIIQDTLEEFKDAGKKVNAKEFVEKMQDKMAVLEKDILYGEDGKYYDYGSEQKPLDIAEYLGDNAEYQEVVYDFKDFETNGSGHYGNENYFAHVRNVDTDINGVKTRIVAEKQSDLFQGGARRYKENNELSKYEKILNNAEENHLTKEEIEKYTKKLKELQKNEKYKIDLNIKEAHPRITREEIQRAINDGKDELLFPKGKAIPFYEGWKPLEGVSSGDGNIAKKLKETDIGDSIEIYGEDYVKIDESRYGVGVVREGGIEHEFNIKEAIDDEINYQREEFAYNFPDLEYGTSEYNKQFEKWVDENVTDFKKEGVLKGDSDYIDENEFVDDLEMGVYGEGRVHYDKENERVYVLKDQNDYQEYYPDEMGGETINPKDMDYDEIYKDIKENFGNEAGTMEYYEKILPKEVKKEAKRFGIEADMNFEDELGLPYVRLDLTKAKTKPGNPVDVFQRQKITKENIIDPQEAVKIVRKYFKPKDLKINLVEKIVTPEGMEAFGKYRDKIITFAKNPIESTPEHEVLHAYFDMMMSSKKQAEILSEVKKTQKIKTNMEAEEWLADNFVEYVRKRKTTGIKGKLKQVIIDLARGLKDIFVENPDKIENMYRDLERLAKGDKRNIGKLSIVGNSIIQENNVEKE